ncbi:hypothetical protein SBI_06733 [Streptomyces bingchenggensis BCW-1]|uniref:Uncharacterized protein n=1 Tax=Streptomyces bingchenggensis (strain BCW-1) TaxID=749414 RepID=D7BXV5_STRBB|nr:MULTISPECIES: hypothetical protein [Streptomyces]ADI09853.1 hypothetical protein SBI_06733 [Streptomyces bingchenggensis BCW-1]
MSVSEAIAWIFEALLRLLLPPSGRHRAAPHQHTPTMPRLARVPHVPAQPALSGAPDDAGPAMVRPYVLAHEQREERAARRLRRQRRRTLWLAVHGIDIGPRVIHGVRVVA